MGRARRVVLVLVIAAAAAAVVTLATGALNSSHNGRRGSAGSPGRSPACLPATLSASAKLPGVALDVSPAPQTDTANPHTQISFLGAAADHIAGVSVTGERSGAHPGRLAPYSQGDGASFLPDAPFDPGERVTVAATVIGGGSAGAGTPLRFSFRVDTPYSTASVAPFPHPGAASDEYRTFRTLPGVRVPLLTVLTPDRDPAAGDVLMTNGPGPGEYGAFIYSPQGRLIWFMKPPPGQNAENLSVQTYEGQRDLTFWQGRVLSLGYGEGEDLVISPRYQVVARIAGANGLKADLHELALAPRNVAYITAFNPIRCDLRSAEGKPDGSLLDTAIQEIDVKTGLVRWEWHSLDHVSVEESQTAAPADTAPWDWFHVNSIDPQPDGNILISARSTWAAYQLEGGSGRILWRLGGTNSSFRMGPGTETAWQHDARILPDGEITLFDDGANPPVHHQSRAVRIALDFATHRATLTADYAHPGPLLSVSQGNAQTLPGGNTVVDYGSIPEVTEYSPGGSLLFDAHLPFAMDNYRGYRFPWTAQPLTPPALLANLNNTGEETIVHASWNGATEVSAWRVLAGSAPSALQPRGIRPLSGFETEIDLPEKLSYVAVQALDAAGHPLGTSPVVKVEAYEASLR